MKKIPLTKGRFAIVDDEDYLHLMQFKWAVSEGYAVRNSETINGMRETGIKMHRQVLAFPKFSLDHINRNRLDNRKCNLRPCTLSTNPLNAKKKSTSTTPYKCVARHKGKWRPYVCIGGKQTYFGLFDTAEQAAFARDFAAKVFHGEFACTNKMLGLL